MVTAALSKRYEEIHGGRTISTIEFRTAYEYAVGGGPVPDVLLRPLFGDGYSFTVPTAICSWFSHRRPTPDPTPSSERCCRLINSLAAGCSRRRNSRRSTPRERPSATACSTSRLWTVLLLSRLQP